MNCENTYELMEIQRISTLLMTCVDTDDVVGARSLLEGVNDQDRKSIVAKTSDHEAPLFVAAMHGNVDMVECLVKEWRADMEELGPCMDLVDNFCHLVTPLWLAAVSNNLEVVKCLIDLGADINASSDTGYSPVYYAYIMRNFDVVKCLVMHGADVRKPNKYGVTCLMVAATRSSREFCHIFIENGADINAKCKFSGITALHRAITGNIKSDKKDIVQLLVDHGADPYLTNIQGNDAFRLASLEAYEPILTQLFVKFEPDMKRRIESYRLLGTSYVINNEIEKALSCWRDVIEIRRINSCVDVPVLQPNPVYLHVQEVNPVEELETLSQNPDFVRMHALAIREQILGAHHKGTLQGLLWQSEMYRKDREYRRCFDILRYALQLQNAGSNPLTTSPLRGILYIHALYPMCWFFCEFYKVNQQRDNESNVLITFEEVLEVLQMATTNVENAAGNINASLGFILDVDWHIVFMEIVLHLVSLITQLAMNSDQQMSFEQIVYRLVRCQLETQQGQTLLHLSVLQSTSHVKCIFLKRDERYFSPLPNIAVVELLLECGANVNAIDGKSNTALHLCSDALRNLELEQHHDMLKRIAVLLLNSSAHVDMVNIFGMRAADGQTSSLLEMNMINFVSLKCLAANAVVKHGISYGGHSIGSLESFVQMHRISASNTKDLV